MILSLLSEQPRRPEVRAWLHTSFLMDFMAACLPPLIKDNSSIALDNVTFQRRTIRKLIRGGGGRFLSTKKYYCKGKLNEKKKSCSSSNRPKKSSCTGLKNSCVSKIPHPHPIIFLTGRVGFPSARKALYITSGKVLHQGLIMP